MTFELGLSGAIIAVAHLMALLQVLTSSATTGSKIGWSIAVILLPVLGFLCWLIAGPRSEPERV